MSNADTQKTHSYQNFGTFEKNFIRLLDLYPCYALKSGSDFYRDSQVLIFVDETEVFHVIAPSEIQPSFHPHNHGPCRPPS